ncbi:uncharacterized protein [Antedon mediterranea]|uniref:uncharacterized protein n=1 Tax=Antedon mediterranea TaxID=105859 RepID=UPI003AF8A2C2
MLWGEAASNVPSNLKSRDVFISAVEEVEEENLKLKSSSSTVVESDSLGVMEDTVIAIGDQDEGFPVDIVMQGGEVYHVPENIDFDGRMELPFSVKYTSNSEGIITSIEVVSE